MKITSYSSLLGQTLKGNSDTKKTVDIHISVGVKGSINKVSSIRVLFDNFMITYNWVGPKLE